MDSKKWTVWVIYTLAFIIPPITVGFTVTVSVLSELMMTREVPQVSIPELTKKIDPTKKTVAVVISKIGTQITDLAAPFEVFGSSGKFNIITVAEERIIVPTTSSLAIVPDYRLDDHPAINILVIPAILDFKNEKLIQWVAKVAKDAELVLSVCEGTRVLAATGLLDGRSATSHFMALEGLTSEYPSIQFIRDSRFVQDGKFITTAGITASIDGSLQALEVLEGSEHREFVEKKMGYKIERDFRSEPIKYSDFINLLLSGGYSWKRMSVGIHIYPDISELGLAALLDTFPRTLAAKTTSIAEKYQVISRHGLQLVATNVFQSLPPLDMIVIPSGRLRLEAKDDLHRLSNEITIKSLQNLPPGRAFEETLKLLGRVGGKPLTAFAAKMVEFPGKLTWGENEKVAQWPTVGLWVRPLLIGFLGLVVVRIFRRRYLEIK